MLRYTDLEDMKKAAGMKDLPDPPSCYEIMKPELVEYIVGEKVSFNYPVLEIFSNHRQVMQGGFISVAFDNAFGLLAFLTAKQTNVVTIDMSVNYHRSITIGDVLTVTVYLQSLGKTMVTLRGEAYDREKNLIATASTNMMRLSNR